MLYSIIIMSEEDAEKKSGESEDELDIGGVSGLPLEVEVNDRYLELIEDPNVRQAMGYVSVSDGEISSSRTRQKLLSWFQGHLKGGYREFTQSRFRILNYLNTVWLCGCENLSPEFWWVNRDPIKRLLYIAMVSEALNRQQYDEKHKPHKEDIPQSILFIHDYITNECGDDAFEELNTEFVGLLKANSDLCDVYLKCFEKKSKDSEEHNSNDNDQSKRRHRKKKE